jgi:copper homeostasis protein
MKPVGMIPDKIISDEVDAGGGRPLVEVCVATVSDAIAAQEAGADRLELCSALEVGGLTPSRAMIEACIAAVSIPVVVMIRPRPGGFCYDDREFNLMRREIDLLAGCGARGVVFGVLNRDGGLDAGRIEKLIIATGPLETVFHRAIDFVRDPVEAAGELCSMGITRVLTSGGEPTAIEGATRIRAMIQATKGRLQVLPGGGVRANNVADLLARTGCDQIHVGASQIELDPSIRHSHLLLGDDRCIGNNGHRRIDPAAIPRFDN